jgi:hypothetical protein
MTQPTVTRRNPWIPIGITVLILVAIGGDLSVPLYAQGTPKIGDFPFFYAWMLMWMPVVAGLLALVQVLQRRLPTDPKRVAAAKANTAASGDKEVK